MADLDPIVPVDVALAALRVIPNDAEVFPMREQFVEVLAAFRATVGRESLRPEIVQAVRDWATAQDWADEGYFDGVWRSLTHVRVGPDRLFGLARSFGFIDDARLDFEADLSITQEKITVAQDAASEQEEKLAAVAKRLGTEDAGQRRQLHRAAWRGGGRRLAIAHHLQAGLALGRRQRGQLRRCGLAE